MSNIVIYLFICDKWITVPLYQATKLLLVSTWKLLSVKQNVFYIFAASTVKVQEETDYPEEQGDK